MNDNYYSADQDIRFRMTTPEEERELFNKAKAGDEKAREFIIHNHLLFAAMQAQAIVKGALPKDEVISAANFAVMKAYDGFDPSRGFRFTTYLRFLIQGEVSHLWRSKFNGNIPDPSLGNAVALLDGNEPADPEPSVEELDFSRFNRAALGRAMAKLTEKDRDFIKLHYYEEMTLTAIGEQWKVTRQAVCAYQIRLIKRLKKLVVEEGIER